MSRGLLILVAACAKAPPSVPSDNPRPIAPAPRAAPIAPPAPSMLAGMPCGVKTFDELDPYSPPKCKRGSCYMGRALSKVGSCTVTASPTFDLYEGRFRSTIFEDGRPILSSDAPPYARTIIFDPRVPTPHEIRVGMTGADLAERFPDAEFECEVDDSGWKGHLLCRVDRQSECDNGDADWNLFVFHATGRLPPGRVTDAAARRLVRARHIAAVDLGPDCGWD